MKYILCLFAFLLLTSSETLAQNRRVDTLFTRKGIVGDSVGAPSVAQWGTGALIFRGKTGLFYVTGNTVSRIDTVGGGGGSGITSLNLLTATSQSFANDANVTIVSSGSVHTLGWSGTLSTARGGTGASSLSNLLGTSNQITVTGGTGRIIGGNATLSLPQNIDTSANFILNSLKLKGNLLWFGTAPSNLGTLDWSARTLSRLIVVPDTSGTMVVLARQPLTNEAIGRVSISGLSSYGSANQIPGTNAAGTSWEYKTLTNGTNINIAHSPGLVTVGITGVVSSSAIPLKSRTNYIPASSDSLVVTVPSAERPILAVTGSYADSRVVPPVPPSIYRLNDSSFVIRVPFETAYDSLKVMTVNTW